jgi:dUTP pyrophosphatase
MLKIEIKCEDGVFPPSYKNGSDSATFDFMAKNFKKLFKGNKEVPLNKKLQQSISEGYLTLRGFERVLIGTGVSMSIPVGYALKIISRSGSTLKQGLIVGNSPAIIDSSYKGEIGVIITNNTPFLSRVQLGDRIAEGIIVKFQHALFEVKDKLE